MLGIDISVIPRQLLQSFNAPFLGIRMIIPLSHSVGTITFFQILWKIGWRVLAAKMGSVLNSSAFRLSEPGAFSFFRVLIAATISDMVGG